MLPIATSIHIARDILVMLKNCAEVADVSLSLHLVGAQPQAIRCRLAFSTMVCICELRFGMRA